MIAAPIIHTRTFCCDFNSEFLVRPESFMDSDIKWARKHVLGATTEIDGLQGVRWLIADNEKYRMAGVVGFLKNICESSQLSVEDKEKSEELFYDDKGRSVYAFIGIVIDKRRSTEYGVVDCSYLWSLYLEKVYSLWKRTYQEVTLEKFMDVKFTCRTVDIEIEPVTAGAQKLFEANPVTDYQLFIDFLCNRNVNNFSFCSNIQDYNSLKEEKFLIATTSQNNIVRIKREKGTTPGVTNKAQTSFLEETVSVQKEQSETSENKKKVLPFIIILMIGLLLLLLIILMLL